MPRDVPSSERNTIGAHLRQIFGQRWRVARQACHLSQRQVSAITGYSQSSLSLWERGMGRGLTLDQAAVLATVVDIPLATLLRESPDAPHANSGETVRARN